MSVPLHPQSKKALRASTLALAITLALALFAAPVAGEAQQRGKVYRIGLCHVASITCLPRSRAFGTA